MYDHNMRRIVSQVSFGRDYSGNTTPGVIDHVPTATEASVEVDLMEGIHNAVSFSLSWLTELLDVEAWAAMVNDTVETLVMNFGVEGAARVAGVEA